MSTKEMICTVCPNGCRLTVTVSEDGTAGPVEGARCERGKTFARQEALCPQRVLTSTVVIHIGNGDRLLPVRSSGAFALDLHLKTMDLLRRTSVAAPIKMGDIILKDVLSSGTDIIASCSVN